MESFTRLRVSHQMTSRYFILLVPTLSTLAYISAKSRRRFTVAKMKNCTIFCIIRKKTGWKYSLFKDKAMKKSQDSSKQVHDNWIRRRLNSLANIMGLQISPTKNFFNRIRLSTYAAALYQYTCCLFQYLFKSFKIAQLPAYNLIFTRDTSAREARCMWNLKYLTSALKLVIRK